MAKYLKKFTNHTDYESFINGGGVELPNVSLCNQENEMHYNPVPQPLIMVYNVDSEEVTDQNIYADYAIDGNAVFSKIEVDGTEIPITSRFDFGTVGNHTVKYTLIDPTTIPRACFNKCSPISVTIPSNVTTIGDIAFCKDWLDAESIASIQAINPNALTSCIVM